MIPEPYNSWPVIMTVSKASKLLGIDRKTLLRNNKLMELCTDAVGNKPKVIRDRLLKELKIIN